VARWLLQNLNGYAQRNWSGSTSSGIVGEI
jgi:hypothetical protein